MSVFDLFAKRFSPKEKLLFRFLRNNQLFYDLTDAETAEFVPYLHLRQYARNEVIFFRNDPAQALYLVKSGRVMLSLDVNDKFETLSEFRPGRAFGTEAILGGLNRRYNAVCSTENCEVYVIPQINLADIFDEDVQIRAKVMTALARERERYLSAVYKIYREAYGFFDLGAAVENAVGDIFPENAGDTDLPGF